MPLRECVRRGTHPHELHCLSTIDVLYNTDERAVAFVRITLFSVQRPIVFAHATAPAASLLPLTPSKASLANDLSSSSGGGNISVWWHGVRVRRGPSRLATPNTIATMPPHQYAISCCFVLVHHNAAANPLCTGDLPHDFDAFAVWFRDTGRHDRIRHGTPRSIPRPRGLW